jgi:hypothetical protein
MAFKHVPSRRESAAGVAVLATLAVIAAGVRLARLTAGRGDTTGKDGEAASATSSHGFPELQVAGALPLSQAEMFDAATLSDKINGKADSYLSAGFVSLRCRRYSLEGNLDAWFELFLFDMGRPDNAFAVFSGQRRETALPLDFPGPAYRSGNALFFTAGPYYVEGIASSETPALQEALARSARDLRALLHPGTSAPTPGEALFPTEGAEKESLTKIASDGFGFDGFDGLWTLRIREGSARLLAFAILCESEAAAQSLSENYGRYLLAAGAHRLPAPADAPGVELFDVFGPREAWTQSGRHLVGVHEADDEGAALSLLKRMAETARNPGGADHDAD